MSDGAREFVIEAFAVWIAGRIREFAALLDPEVAWDLTAHPLPDVPDTGSGRDALLHHLRHYGEGWSDYEATLADAQAIGDDVVCVVRERVSMGGTATVLDRDLVLVWTVAGERLTCLRAFKTREDALAALGGA
ncbi:MAG TPA: nuclear transport factor 2 family protein [Thermoleophilaceae bacterium]|nr:nuclear transport factor 2 family protein [Thermoleophilaceae bacterium]